jgi:PAS domain S-box-containing protein
MATGHAAHAKGMPVPASRGWPTLPLIGVGIAAASEAARLVLHHPTGGPDVALAVVGFCALITAAAASLQTVFALQGATTDEGELDAARAEAEGWKALADGRAEVIDGAGEAIIVIDDQGTIVTFNRAAERMFGYSAEELLGTSLERLMTEGGRKAHAAYLAETGVTAMVEAARLRTTHRGVRKRGDVFAFELLMTEWADHLGRRMFTGVLHDVTQRERVADEANEADKRFSELFEAVGEPMFVFGLDGDGTFRLDSMNQRAEKLTGASRYAASGWTPDRLGKNEGRALKRALLETLSSGKPITADVPFAVGEQQGTLALALAPMKSGDGEIHRVLVRVLPRDAAAKAKTAAA